MAINVWRTAIASTLLLPCLANAADLGPVLGTWVGEGLSCSVLKDGGEDRIATIEERRISRHESECDIRGVRTNGSTIKIETLCEGEGTSWEEVITLERRGKKMFIDGDGPYVRCGSQAP